MGFHIDANTFAKGLKTALGFIPKRPVQPVLSNFLLEVKNNALLVSATDLFMGITVTIPLEKGLEGDNSFRTTVAAKLFSNLVSQLEGTLTVYTEEKEENLLVSTEEQVYKLPCLPPDEYPKFPQQDSPGIVWEAEAFKKAVSKVLYASSNDSTKLLLNGINFRSQDETVKVAATDGNRLGVVKSKLKAFSEIKGLTLPNTFLVEAIKACDEGSIELKNTPEGFLLESKNVVLFARSLEGDYPKYDQLFQSHDKKALIALQKIVSALKRLKLIADKKNKIVVFKFDRDQQRLTLSIEAAEVGTGVEIIPITYSGESLTIALNVDYVLEALGTWETEIVTFYGVNPTDPVLLVEEEKTTHLLASVAIREV